MALQIICKRPLKSGLVKVKDCRNFCWSLHLRKVEISESHSLLEPIFKVKATDEDEGLNGEVNYGFSKETETKFGQLFFMNNVTGEVTNTVYCK